MPASILQRAHRFMRVVVPSGWTDAEVVEFAKRESSGREFKIVRANDPMLKGCPERVASPGQHQHAIITLERAEQ